MKRTTPPVLRLGQVTARLLRQGDSYPCPKKGHPAFVHERAEPCVTLHMGKTLLRIFPLAALGNASTRNLCGSDRGRYWALTVAQIDALKEWAVATAEKYPARAVEPKRKKVRKRQTVTPPPGFTARRARVHPVAVRGVLNDCDYLHKLSPEERAWKDQFDRETVLNRWYDREGVEAFYPRGSEERRLLQFEFNRRYDDIYNSKEWWPVADEITNPTTSRHKKASGNTSVLSRAESAEVLYGSRVTGARNSLSNHEDTIIEAIDRSREGYGK